MKYAFIAEYAHEHSISLMCKVLKVSKSGYYSFAAGVKSEREKANEQLVGEIQTVYEATGQRYGSPRIYKHLKQQGASCGRHRIARLMAQNGLVARAGRRFRITTRRAPNARYATDKLQRNFTAERPHQVWVSDITYIWTLEGWLYLAVVLDLFSRMVVGWATGASINAGLVCRAINSGLLRHGPAQETIFHSDKGSQYTSDLVNSCLAHNPEVPLIPSHGSSCYDNAVAESFFHTLKTECAQELEHLRTRQQAHRILFDYIEIFYNRQRLHSSIGDSTPALMMEKYFSQEQKELNSLSEETGQ